MEIKNGVLIRVKSEDLINGVFTVPNDITIIESGAFWDCTTLTSVIIGNSVTNIGSYAFYRCISLKEIIIPDSVTSIGEGAFYNCVSLQNIEIPNSVTSIGGSAFFNCMKLQKTDNKYYYKAFNKNLTCINFQYKENKLFKCKGRIKLCRNGFHACKNAFDLFCYYNGELNKDIAIYKVELKGVSKKKNNDSKVVAKKIRLVKKINSYNELLN